MIRDLDDPKMLDRYIEIKAAISELEEELEEIKPHIQYALMGEDRETYDHMGFSFRLTRRKTYKYSDEIERATKGINDAKAQERADGTAEVIKDQVILQLVPYKGA